MKLFFQSLFAIVMALLILFIFSYSFVVLNTEYKNEPAPAYPKAPAALVIDPIDVKLDPKVQEEQVKLVKFKVDAYTQQVAAYNQEVAAYKLLLDKEGKTNDTYNKRLELFKTVIKDTLVFILTTLITTIAVYVFGANALRMYLNYRLGKASTVNDVLLSGKESKTS